MPLTPVAYRKTAETHRRDTRANQPAAADVLEGTLYYVTDESVMERSTGSVWESVTTVAAAAGSDGDIQFALGGVLAGSDAFRYFPDAGFEKFRLTSSTDGTALTVATAPASSTTSVYTTGPFFVFGAVGVGGYLKILADSSAYLTSGIFYPDVDNSVDLGKLANRWKDAYLSGAVNLKERTAPSAPAANCANVWIQDNGAGKTQLMVEFNTGGPIQIAIQP